MQRKLSRPSAGGVDGAVYPVENFLKKEGMEIPRDRSNF